MNRHGIALLSALSLLTLLGLLIAGAVASVTVAHRATRVALLDGSLSADADYALMSVLGESATYGLADLPLGQARTFDVPPGAGIGVLTSVSATRLPAGLLWLVAVASIDGYDRGARRANLIARFPVAGAPPAAPIVARGGVALAADVTITPDGGGDADCAVTTSPAPLQTSDSVALFQTARQLAVLDSAPGVRHVRGDTTITSGTYNGMLLVDGTLTIDGPFVLIGLVIARGAIRSSHGLTVVGALISQAAGPLPAIDLAGANIRYSPCATALALRLAAPPRSVRGRAWAEMF